MRPFRKICILTAALLALLLLAACGGEPSLERVDVVWATDPPPRWGVYPGNRQEVPFQKGSSYHVRVYSAGREVTGGTVGDTGRALAFRPSVGAKDIEAVVQGADGLQIYATLRSDKGAALRVLALKVERQGDKIYFEVPK